MHYFTKEQVYFTIKRINKGLKLNCLYFLNHKNFTIKRINKGLKLFPCCIVIGMYFTIKRINKGLKPCLYNYIRALKFYHKKN